MKIPNIFQNIIPLVSTESPGNFALQILTARLKGHPLRELRSDPDDGIKCGASGRGSGGWITAGVGFFLCLELAGRYPKMG